MQDMCEGYKCGHYFIGSAILLLVLGYYFWGVLWGVINKSVKFKH